jgi:hypothetical protein
MSANETRVITPGGLDILTRLLEIHSRPTYRGELDFLLKRWNNECGQVQYGHIGANGNDWHSDWALVCLETEWKGANGSWMDDGEMRDKYIATSSAPERTFIGSSGIITCADAMADTICYKDGACTSCTAGRVGLTEALMFKEEMQEQNTPASEVDCTRLVRETGISWAAGAAGPSLAD